MKTSQFLITLGSLVLLMSAFFAEAKEGDERRRGRNTHHEITARDRGFVETMEEEVRDDVEAFDAAVHRGERRVAEAVREGEKRAVRGVHRVAVDVAGKTEAMERRLGDEGHRMRARAERAASHAKDRASHMASHMVEQATTHLHQQKNVLKKIASCAAINCGSYKGILACKEAYKFKTWTRMFKDHPNCKKRFAKACVSFGVSESYAGCQNGDEGLKACAIARGEKPEDILKGHPNCRSYYNGEKYKDVLDEGEDDHFDADED